MGISEDGLYPDFGGSCPLAGKMATRDVRGLILSDLFQGGGTRIPPMKDGQAAGRMLLEIESRIGEIYSQTPSEREATGTSPSKNDLAGRTHRVRRRND